METMGPIIFAISLILGDILLLKIGLAITKAQEKTNMKWVAASFGIQFGIIFFVASPLFLLGMMGRLGGEGGEGGEGGIIAIVIIFSVFIDLNVINVIHRIGLKRSVVVVIFVVVPIIMAMVFLGTSLGGTL